MSSKKFNYILQIHCEKMYKSGVYEVQVPIFEEVVAETKVVTE